MNPKLLILIIVVIVVILVAVWAIARMERRRRLRRSFGPEYERMKQQVGAPRADEALLEREKRVHHFHIRPLSAEERERFVTQWREVQTRFVDDPQGAVADADRLVNHLMQERGYPMTEFEQRAADLSVGYPKVVDNYRAAHQIALRHQQGLASTEDLRNALIYYRSLFDELLQTTSTGHTKEVA